MHLIIIALVWSGMVACATPAKHTDTLDFTQSVPSLNEEKRDTRHILVPEECFDDNGIFDADLGHDTLDCGNL